MPATSLDIILPCFNPPPGWANNIINVYKEISVKIPGVTIKLFIINDGSSKIDAMEIDKINTITGGIKFISYSLNKGKGYALRKGVNESNAELVIYTDIDFPYTTLSFIKIWDQLNDGKTDIAVGVKNDNYYKHVPFSRRVISKILRSCTKFILKLKVSDTQCGLKGFNYKGKEVFLKTKINRYLFDLEFIFLASKNNAMALHPVEIELKENIQFSSMRSGVLISEGINFIKIFFKSL